MSVLVLELAWRGVSASESGGEESSMVMELGESSLLDVIPKSCLFSFRFSLAIQLTRHGHKSALEGTIWVTGRFDEKNLGNILSTVE